MVWVAITAGVVLLSYVAPFPFLIDAMNPGRVVWRMPPRQRPPAVYLTFDDGPNPTATPALLDVLETHRARATFFLIDDHLTDQTAPLIRRMFEEGHGVALHSNNRWLAARSPGSLAGRLTEFAGRIEGMTGQRPCRAFRPHGGNRSQRMLLGLARIDHQLIGWSWLGWDFNWFRARTADSVTNRISARASDGFIAVIHDGHHRDPVADRRYAVEAVERLVPALRARGFELRTICEDLDDAR
jgi:chitooligosaccharide deacetylase